MAKRRGLAAAVKADQAIGAGVPAEPEGRIRLTISLSIPAATLVRDVSHKRGRMEGTGGNVSALLEGLIREHWSELVEEAKGEGASPY